MAGALRGPATVEATGERGSWSRALALLLVALLATGGLLVAARTVRPPDLVPALAHSSDSVTILAGGATTLDPARQGDVSSAQISSQLFESLTAIDPSLRVQPALASSWDVQDGGRRVVFHLRPALVFSDGSPLGASDVVRSWMRVIDPTNPSPLASLLLDVDGVAEHLAGSSAPVGVQAQGSDVVVTLRRPAADFPAIAANVSLAVVPPSIDSSPAALQPGSFVGSGAYVLTSETPSQLTMTANPHYWAGTAPIRTVKLLEDTGGRSPTQLFSDGTVDYTDISSIDAGWIAFDKDLGPSLRVVNSLSVDYYGFDVRQAPFNDVRVRRAFADAVDWKRVVELAVGNDALPATGMVPPGIPGRGNADYSVGFDPAQARADLAAAGYPGGRGFPAVTLLTGGSSYDAGVAAQLKENLGITIKLETEASNDYFTRLETGPPAFWSLSWVADYPGPNDFLGMLLGSGQANNYGHWSSPEFDQAITDAGSTTDPAAVAAAFDRAQKIVQRDVPVIPVSYSSAWALARPGLLGARENGLGMVRFAGLAWGAGQ